MLASIPYPEGILHVEPGEIDGPAFFPGGTGIFDGHIHAHAPPGRSLPQGGVLVLGHNFHDLKSFEASVEAGGEVERTPTWRNLLRMLSEFGIEPSTCFFTNAYMGLMESAEPMGTHSGHRDPVFREHCINLLRATMELQRPKLVMALGKQALRLLADVIPGLEAWRRCWSFKEFEGLRLNEAGLHTCLPGGMTPMACVVVTHPCLGPSNRRHRSSGG